ncbi:MAG TPA: 50S ribosomal protein L4 [Jiangellaceae bacterium]|nr:50S ribosomal protein L4 [Jiangellaceae bacterium]
MSTISVLDAGGGKAGTVELPADVFGVQVSVPLIHQVVVAQLAAARQGTHSTKSRGEVAGGGAKPYRQKGTGRARQGSIRAPQFAGGGVVHGPTPRDYAQRTPKKMKAAALRGALSDRAQHERVHVVAGFVEGTTPSTKAALATLAKITERPNVLVVVERGDEVTAKSLRNAPRVHLLVADQLNTYDVLCADDIVFTKAALEAFLAGAPRGKVAQKGAQQAPAAAQKEAQKATPQADASPAAEAPGAVTPAEFGPDSAEPLADGSAPEGFTIKGNKDSMKYHLPDGRWYEATVAEVWFRTEDAAHAAGFAKAGTKAKEDGK